MLTYVRYSDDVEEIALDEADTIDKIMAAMCKGADAVREKEGHAYRASHAKAHALVRGELTIEDSLPPELAQGLFARAGRYAVVARLAHVPGELLDDRKVSTPRGFALKVLGVEGPMAGGQTQDWVLDTGEVFIASGIKTFLQQITMTEGAAAKPEGLHAAVSAVSRLQNAALNAVGLNSANLDFYGHPKLDPLTETYYSQTPFRYVHLSVCSRGDRGERLNPRKADLEQWRQTFAQALRDRGVEAEATPRRARGVTRKAERTPLRKIQDRAQAGVGPIGRAKRGAYRDAAKAAFQGDTALRPWERQMAERQALVRRTYLAQAKLLRASSDPLDQTLGAKVEAFVQGMPQPDSQRLALARELRAANRATDRNRNSVERDRHR